MRPWLRDGFRVLNAERRYWLYPMIVLLVLFGALILLTDGSAVAPFIYTLF